MLQFKIHSAALRESYLDRIAIAYLSTMIHRDALWILKLRKEKVSKMTMKRQKTLHRFAAVAAVLLTFCLVFMMPAAASLPAPGENGVITLEGDVELSSSYLVSSALTIDLNGHSIAGGSNTVFTVQENGKLTITNTGTKAEITSTNDIIVVNGGNSAVKVGDNVVLNTTAEGNVFGIWLNLKGRESSVSGKPIDIDLASGATIKGNGGIALSTDTVTGGVDLSGITIAVSGTIDGDLEHAAASYEDVTEDGKTGASALYINGNFQITDSNKAPTFTIHPGATIDMEHYGSTVIYAAGYANWHIYGGTLTAHTPLSIKSGNVVIGETLHQGPTVTADGVYVDPVRGNNNGSEDTGAAVSITSNPGYAKKTDVVINGGVFTSTNGHAVYEGIAIKDGVAITESSYLNSLTINEGNFYSPANREVIQIEKADASKVSINDGNYYGDLSMLKYLSEDAQNVAVYLDDDVTVSESITLTQGRATIYLNSNTLTAGVNAYTSKDDATGIIGNRFIVIDGGELVITDISDSKTGEITSSKGTIWVKEGVLNVLQGTITGGTDYETILVSGSSESTASDFSTVTIENDAKVTGGRYSVSVTYARPASDDSRPAYGVQINIHGTLEGTVAINGCIKPTTGNVPKFHIYDNAMTGEGTTITGGSDSDNAQYPAVYAAGYAEWTIDDAAFSGTEALSIKSGKFTINGGTFTATGANTVPPTENDNGPEKTGAALSITSNDDYAGEIDVTVNGGEFISQNGHAVYEGIAEKNGVIEASASKVKSISIKAGSFESANTLDVVRIDEASNKKVVSGGVFNQEVKADYIADNCVSTSNVVEDTKTEYPYRVAAKNPVFSVRPAEIPVTEGYTPNEHTITLTNIGNVRLNVTSISSEGDLFTNSTVSGELIPGGDAVTFTIKSKTSLPVGDYKITITAKTFAGDEVSKTVTFKVTAKGSTPITPPPVTPDQPTERPSSGGSTDTGSGNYNEYPRQADGTAGEISFGSSKDVKAVDLPEGVTGEVKLIAKSTHPAPEGKDTHKVFEINIPNYPTGKPATIKFEMTLADIEAKGLTAADVCLYHFNKETGLWEKLPTTFKVVDGKVYFEAVTTGFSPFAIVFEKGAATPAAGADEPVTPPTETPDVPETPGTLPPVDTPETPEQPTESPAPILAVLAGLGAAVVLRRK